MRQQAPVTVLLIIRHMNMGGAQRQLYHLARGLDRSRFEPVVVCLHREEPLLAELRGHGVETYCLPARKGLDPTLPLRIAGLARKKNARILHSYLFAANAWSRMAAIFASGRITVASERSANLERRKREIALERVLARWTDAFTVNAKAVGKVLADQVPAIANRISCIYNGVDLVPFAQDPVEARRELLESTGAPVDAFLIGVLGNLTPDKGHRFILEALQMLADRGRRPHLLLIGEGSERASIESMAARGGLAERVHLLGLRDDVPRVLLGLDALAQCSLREGMPNAVLEGMAASLPILATDVGGTREAVADGQCGLLVAPCSAGALAEGIATLLDRPDHASELARRARRRVEDRFGLERMVRETEQLYDSLLGTR